MKTTKFGILLAPGIRLFPRICSIPPMVQKKEPNVMIEKSSDGINDLSPHADKAVEDRDPVDTVNAGGDGEPDEPDFTSSGAVAGARAKKRSRFVNGEMMVDE